MIRVAASKGEKVAITTAIRSGGASLHPEKFIVDAWSVSKRPRATRPPVDAKENSASVASTDHPAGNTSEQLRFPRGRLGLERDLRAAELALK